MSIKETRILMGMPATIEIVDFFASKADLEKVFSYFKYVEEKFSPFRSDSELSAINRGQIKESDWSQDMKIIFELSEKTKKETNGYFDIVANNGKYNPSGLVKGWAIYNGALILKNLGFKNFYVEIAGDIQVFGKNSDGQAWKIGIKNPFSQKEIVKAVYLKDQGIATSGTYIRGQHIYNPQNRNEKITDIVSLTVIGPNIYEADRFATSAFAMGRQGINFIENLSGFEAYMIDKNKIATMTGNFNKYLNEDN